MRQSTQSHTGEQSWDSVQWIYLQKWGLSSSTIWPFIPGVSGQWVPNLMSSLQGGGGHHRHQTWRTERVSTLSAALFPQGQTPHSLPARRAYFVSTDIKLTCARHCCKSFTIINSFVPLKTIQQRLLSLSRWGKSVLSYPHSGLLREPEMYKHWWIIIFLFHRESSKGLWYFLLPQQTHS